MAQRRKLSPAEKSWQTRRANAAARSNAARKGWKTRRKNEKQSRRPKTKAGFTVLTDFFGIKEAIQKHLSDRGEAIFSIAFQKGKTTKDDYDAAALKRKGDKYHEKRGDPSHYWRINTSYEVEFSDKIDGAGKHLWVRVTDATPSGTFDDDDDDRDDDDENEELEEAPF